ncbi:hypothetical protein ASPZODRAFT_129606 [Penicilliopsis zonata CBS 506.65]|uniref:NYN domain-containing protein n=1 Tax=Penicilliopsis zonata CBS 506.65 TaxID=1073090 RepID=A0A1L9SQ41_9EURO|nr:hypothetical protein ASPZODRAFT_129606 [Penicilliopsis zonata CBS 506.65]OJJ49193.1 hypothetical protein ASPZODRAFT_129606 [Penicilliopsis zonata CBS 506.65]
MPSIETASSWDFTSVIDLIRSPTYGGSQAAVAPSNNNAAERLKNTNDAETKASGQQDTRSHTPLGDFGSLWDFLGSCSKESIVKAPEAHAPRGDPANDASEPPISPPTSFKILQRPTNNKKLPSNSLIDAPPRTPARGISFSSRRQPQKPRITTKICNTGIQDPGSLTESGAEAESDGNVSIFDAPQSTKRGITILKPSRVDVQGALSDNSYTPPSSYDESENRLVHATAIKLPATYGHSDGCIHVQSVLYRSYAERRIGLLTKLLKKFPEYSEVVSQVGQSQSQLIKIDRPVLLSPIHIFIDMSNIMVGFHDCVKVSRNIPVKTRIRRLPLSFQNLSLILERGRPTAKRVLVGSDRLPTIDDAETLGYEANILDRVHKVKHMTPRQQRFRNVPPSRASEMNAGTEERWVEQGVDEILHLKILESLVDTAEPATIVLATGDAAEAEYSGGFMKMVERALQRGWRVELVSFSQVMSKAYRRKEFRAKWGSKFKVIKLDDYIEELFHL